jgi:hypothetical protein
MMQNIGKRLKNVRNLKKTLLCGEMKWNMVQINVRTIFTFEKIFNLCQTTRNYKKMISADSGNITKQSKLKTKHKNVSNNAKVKT